MVLNYDCLRDVLLSLENKLVLDINLRFQVIHLREILEFTDLSEYSEEDIYYSIFNLLSVKFIDGAIEFADGGYLHVCIVSNITYIGHEFLQSIKSEAVWKNIKSKIKPIAGLSIPLITEVAKEIIVSSIKIK